MLPPLVSTASKPTLSICTDSLPILDCTNQFLEQVRSIFSVLKAKQNHLVPKSPVMRLRDEEESPRHYSELTLFRTDSNFGEEEICEEIHFSTIFRACDAVFQFLFEKNFFTSPQPGLDESSSSSSHNLNDLLNEAEAVWKAVAVYYSENIQKKGEALIASYRYSFSLQESEKQSSFYQRSFLLIAAISSIYAVAVEKKVLAAVGISSFIIIFLFRLKQFLSRGVDQEVLLEKIGNQINHLGIDLNRYYEEQARSTETPTD